MAPKKSFFSGEISYKTLLSAMNKSSQAASRQGRFGDGDVALRLSTLLDEVLDKLVEEKYDGIE